ncbi:hypothetical protein [Paraburkholderia sp. BR14374]|uniref:hypothetical protein n=1 Tax=Paraburkholderia sp. BR14374 TaxID=3237007 RepID=UPI0034CEBDA4
MHASIGSMRGCLLSSATTRPIRTLAERLAARGIDSLRHDEPALHAGLFSAARTARDKLSPTTKPSI